MRFRGSSPILPESFFLAFSLADVEGDETQQLRKHPKQKCKKRVSFNGQVNCACKRQCANIIDIVRQKEIFDRFHRQSWCQQTQFLRGAVLRRATGKENVNPTTKVKRKDFVSAYFLRDDHGVMHQVCLHFLSRVLQVNRSRIHRSITSNRTNPSGTDRRGKYPSRKAKLKDVQYMTNFIKIFPQFESRYCKSHSDTKYVHPNLNIRKLFEQYKTKCSTDQQKQMSLSYFMKFFKQFNLKFPKRRTSNCLTCNHFESMLKRSVISHETREKLSNEKQEHNNLAIKIVNDYEKEVRNARESVENIEIFSFGLGQSFDLPHLSPSDYTKRSLWLHEFCIFDEVRLVSYVYAWPESVASKGSQEIASCIIYHLQKLLSPKSEKLILYCDPYFGQNRNVNLFLMIHHFLDSWPHPNLISIQQKFFVSGHGYNNCDRSFDDIKKKERSMQSIYVPSHRINFINNLRCIWKVCATEMRGEHFFSSKPLKDLVVTKKIAINWCCYHSITYNRNEPFYLHIKSYDNTSLNINLKKQDAIEISEVTLPNLYPNGRNISKQKFKDLQELMNFIPTEFHTFYESFKYTDTKEEIDYVFSLRESSDEEEQTED